MTTLAELVDSFNTVITAVDLAVQHRAGAPADEAGIMRQRMASQLVDAWLAAMAAHTGAQDGQQAPPAPQQAALPLPVAPAAPQAPRVATAAEAQDAVANVYGGRIALAPQAPAPGPLADTLAKIAAGLQQAPQAPPTSAPAPPPGVQGSFDEWVALADALGRNVADLQRQWHSSRDGIEGGWDKATDAQRAEQMAKALAYYQNKAAEPGEIDHTVCFKCGSKGRELKTRTGETFYACSNERCGFNGREGKFVNTTWDALGYSDRRAKWEETKRRGQQRGFARR